MNDVYVAVGGLTVLANAGVAAAGFAKADFVVKNAAEVGAPRSWVPFLAFLKAAGALGLLLGLLGVPIVGTVAAAGLVAFFVVAIGFHIHSKVFYNIAFPGFFLALATASLVLSVR